jgi:hypothetical protein
MNKEKEREREREREREEMKSSISLCSLSLFQFDKEKYEKLMNEPLRCPRCKTELPNIPKAKQHVITCTGKK